MLKKGFIFGFALLFPVLSFAHIKANYGPFDLFEDSSNPGQSFSRLLNGGDILGQSLFFVKGEKTFSFRVSETKITKNIYVKYASLEDFQKEVHAEIDAAKNEQEKRQLENRLKIFSRANNLDKTYKDKETKTSSWAELSQSFQSISFDQVKFQLFTAPSWVDESNSSSESDHLSGFYMTIALPSVTNADGRPVITSYELSIKLE